MVLVQFKGPTKYSGRTYRQNERVSFPEPTAARLVSLHVAVVVRGERLSDDFAAMVEMFRSAELRKNPPPSKEARAKAWANAAPEMERFAEQRGPRHATQF